MSSPSNLYAEKAFAENPISLWPLDDPADYVSLISNSQRSLSGWTVTRGTFSSNTQAILDEPFQSSAVSGLSGNVPSGDSGSIVCVSPNLVRLQDLNKELATFAIGSYIYSDSLYIESVEIGYEYDDVVTDTLVQKLKTFSSRISSKWFFVSETFNIPDDDAFVRLVIKINYFSGGAAPSDYKFYINGISFGQWSEEFNATSLGVEPELIPEEPSEIALSQMSAIKAFPYGLQESYGYYIVKDNALLAKNSSIPMVYGSSSVTCISKNTEGLPSLIIPGYGMLNESGQYKTYTLEFWLRIISDTQTPKRIMGPISSTDGLYVNGSILTLKIGDNVGHHFINEWGRPMLMHIRVFENQAILMINGEQVISVSFLTSGLDLPSLLSSEGKSQDWMGFYSYDRISSFEIDCVAIYSYQVSETVAKRRFVYGQGVEFPENINTAYSGTTALVDYSFAEYSNSYNFPEASAWGSGVLDNMRSSRSVISSPEYLPPTPFFNSDFATKDRWLSDLTTAQNESSPFITLKPNSEWNATNGYLVLSSITQTLQSPAAIYGIFKRTESNTSEQVLFELKNSTTSDKIFVTASNSSIKYKVTYLNVTTTIYETFNNFPGEVFAVGFNINDFSRHFGGNVSKVLGSLDQLALYIGGNSDLDKTFTGKIYSFGICNERNFTKIKDLFSPRGMTLDYENVFDLYSGAIDFDGGTSPAAVGGYYDNDGNFVRLSQSYWDYFIDGGSPTSFVTNFMSDHVASYQLVPSLQFGSVHLDVAADSYWEDYVPLTYFAKYVRDNLGDQYYSLDFLQFNLGYPAPATFSEQETSGSWTYAELQTQYSNPIQRDYEDLANQLFTGYQDYDDLKNKVVKTYSYDTQSNPLRSYVSFQYLSTGANAPYTNFSKSELVPKNGVIQPGSDWMNTKYEVVDNVILYPPSGVDITQLAVVIHLELTNPGVASNPIKIKSVQLAGQALNADSSNKVGTRFGVPMFPYKKSGLYFDYKAKNPYSIYKSSSPYLYLTRSSGIQLRGDHSPAISRGISIPMNSSRIKDYKVAAMQTMLRYDEDFFPYTPVEIFEIQGKFVHLKFFLVATHPSGQRAKIYAVNALTGKLENGIGFFLNGNLVKEPTITIKEWAFLGVSFANSLLDLNLYVGAIRLTGPALFNNISYYESTSLQGTLESIKRIWFQVKQEDLTDLEWQFWYDVGIWDEVLVLSSSAFSGTNPADIYKSYTGTNKIVIDDDRPFRLNSYQYKIYSDVSWQSKVASAV
jgi:hypothetical protein